MYNVLILCKRQMKAATRTKLLGLLVLVTAGYIVYICTLRHTTSWNEDNVSIQAHSKLWLNYSHIPVHMNQDIKVRKTINVYYDNVKNDKPFQRIDTTPEQTQKLPFLMNFKNPCWKELYNRNVSIFRCLPYFYQIGPPKCGTSDLFTRLTRHPQISKLVIKELQWISKNRFTKRGMSNLSTYLNYFQKAVNQDVVPNNRGGYHSMILGDFSPSTIWYNPHYWNNSSMTFKSNADVIYHLNPNTKILVTLRNPVNRTFSDYKHFHLRTSPTTFHNFVMSAIQEFNRLCAQTKNLMRCIDLFGNGDLRRMFIGLYSINIEDFLRVFPRNQIYISRLEDRQKNMTAALENIFSFLNLEPLDKKEIQMIANLNKTAKDTHTGYDMFEETRHKLEEFFKPFNDKLGALLGQEYNYNLHP